MKELESLYKKYDFQLDKNNESLSIIYRISDILETRYKKETRNVEYALSYILFLLSESEVMGCVPELLAFDFVAPFKDDPRCAVVRCQSYGILTDNFQPIKEYEGDTLLSKTTSRIERSVLFYIMSEAEEPSTEKKLNLLLKSLNAFPYNFSTIRELLLMNGVQKSLRDYLIQKFPSYRIFVNRLHMFYPYLFFNKAFYKRYLCYCANLDNNTESYWDFEKNELHIP